MPVNHQTALVAETELTGRNQEFQFALESYIEGYRAAQLVRRPLPLARRSLLERWKSWQWVPTEGLVQQPGRRLEGLRQL